MSSAARHPPRHPPPLCGEQAAQGEPRHASYSISNDFRGYAELSSDQVEADAEAEGGAEAGESPYSPEAAYDYEDDEAD